MKTFKQFIQSLEEGVNDPGIFKAVFLAGGPGSGKSFVARQTLPRDAFGLKVVNSDDTFEFLLQRSGLPLKMLELTPEEWDRIQRERARAKELTKKMKAGFLNGRLGMVIDGTGKDFEKIKKQRSELESYGYDTYMVFVNTSLAVALERNANRSRSVPEEIVRKSWNEVQNNIGKFQQLFGGQNFIIVDNNEVNEDLLKKVFKEVRKFANRPVQSKLARDWIEAERNKARR